MNRRHVLSALMGLLSFRAAAQLEVGAMAPDFSLRAALDGREFRYSLSDALAKGPVVLYFFPAAYSEGCSVEAHTFAEAMADFNAAGAPAAQTWGASVRIRSSTVIPPDSPTPMPAARAGPALGRTPSPITTTSACTAPAAVCTAVTRPPSTVNPVTAVPSLRSMPAARIAPATPAAMSASSTAAMGASSRYTTLT